MAPLLRGYLLASHALPLVAPTLLRRRLARGKEDPERWQEKLGRPSLARPEGPLIWMHAVGLGEVLALRGLIAEIGAQAPDAHFLVTSTARSSAQVIGANLPPRTCHQFLPLDAPSYLARFLEHWRPALSIWAEQDIWPGAIVSVRARGIPLALINARLTAEGHARRARAKGVFADLLGSFARVSAQDEGTVRRLTDLGARDVRLEGSLKAATPPLHADEAELVRLQSSLSERKIWVAASTHATDETEVLEAVRALPERLCILAPRDVSRADAIARTLTAMGLEFVRRSTGARPGPTTHIWLADSYGELGLWYRLAETAFIGGSFGTVGGHNPWEAAALDTAILHGPNVTNFATDYETLDQAQASRRVVEGGIAGALSDPDLASCARRARSLSDQARGRLAPLARDLLSLARLP